MKNKGKDVIINHPHKQHSFQLAAALKNDERLLKYITTVYDSERSYTMKIKRYLKGNQLKKANGRKCNELDDNEVVQFYELLMLIYLAIIRIPKSINIARKIDRYISSKFGKKIAKFAYKNNAKAVIGYDRYSNECFKILKNTAPSIIRILDVSIVTTAYMRNTFESDIIKNNSDDLKKENLFLWNSKIMKNYMEEIKNTDFFLAPSEVVKRSLEFCGVSEDKIKIVPYGVDINNFTYKRKKVNKGPLNLLFVGQVNTRKGIHHLLDVIKRFKNQEVHLELVGTYDEKSQLYINNCNIKNVKFTGFITGDILAKKYQEADVFILPSLGEGMALVGLEALATGTPIICSDESGVNDIVINGENGYVFEAGDNNSLENAIKWFIENKNLLPEMSENSRKIAEQYTWEKYRTKVSETIDDIISQSNIS